MCLGFQNPRFKTLKIVKYKTKYIWKDAFRMTFAHISWMYVPYVTLVRTDIEEIQNQMRSNGKGQSNNTEKNSFRIREHTLFAL